MTLRQLTPLPVKPEEVPRIRETFNLLYRVDFALTVSFLDEKLEFPFDATHFYVRHETPGSTSNVELSFNGSDVAWNLKPGYAEQFSDLPYFRKLYVRRTGGTAASYSVWVWRKPTEG